MANCLTSRSRPTRWDSAPFPVVSEPRAAQRGVRLKNTSTLKIVGV